MARHEIEDTIIEKAENEQRFDRPNVRSEGRGKPLADVLAVLEESDPEISEKLGLSSAAMRAGALVRAMRKRMKLTQTQLADKLGWTQERISNIECGVGSQGPTFDVLSRIATVCNMRLAFIPNSKEVEEVNLKIFSGESAGGQGVGFG